MHARAPRGEGSMPGASGTGKRAGRDPPFPPIRPSATSRHRAGPANGTAAATLAPPRRDLVLETLTHGFSTPPNACRACANSPTTTSRKRSPTCVLAARGRCRFRGRRLFLARVKERALGEKVKTRVRDKSGQVLRATPAQHFVAIAQDELIKLMGPVDTKLSRARGV